MSRTTRGRVAADRALDAGLGAFALWTACTNVTVLAGGGLDHALIAFAPLVLVAAALALRTPPAAPRASAPCPNARPAWIPGAVVVAAAVAGGLVLESSIGRWALALAAAVLGLGHALRRRGSRASDEPGATIPSATDVAVLAACALAGAVLALCFHRPDSDDGFYLNLAVAAADAPAAPLFARDTLHGLGPAPAWISIYAVQSFELAIGAVARLTGLEPIELAHTVVPVLGACLLPFALARAMRALVPGTWLPATLAALVFLVAAGDARNPYGEFALLRLQQGKSWFAVGGVALLVATALELARAPSRSTFVRLAAVQIACVGWTSGALWMAPTIVALTLVGALAGRPLARLRATVGTLASGLASSFWPLGLALVLRSRLQAAVASFTEQFDEGDRFVEAADRVFGDDPLRVVVVAAALGVPFVAASSVARRTGAVFVVAFLTCFWNPLLDDWLARTLTGIPTYWRVFWLLPVPLLVGLLLSAPFAAGTPRAARLVGAAVIVALGAVGFARRSAVPQAHGIRIGPPGVHVDHEEQAVVRALVDATEPGEPVLAPRAITRWLVAQREHPFPLVSRQFYLEPLRGAIGDDEVEARLALWRMTETGPFAQQALARAIDDFELAALAVKVRGDSLRGQAVPRTILRDMRRAFRAAGLERVELELDGPSIYEVWAR